jgi:aminoglycoside/choline kinase family phosphotransferase
MSDRETAMHEFLAASGWGDAVVTPLPGDASTRRYARLALDGRKAMLMDQPQGAETPTAPPEADEATRRALGYNAVARLAGADCARFAAVATWLRGKGLAAPEILAADCANGFLIIEDFGDALFADVLADGGNEKELYEAAAKVLARLHAEQAPPLLDDATPLFHYDDVALIAETDLLTQWFLPMALGRDATEQEILAHRSLWHDVLAKLPEALPVFVHRDYHAQNLIWMPHRTDPENVGLIDFQDAVAGSRAYDLISLTEDARRDVAPDLAEFTVQAYLKVATTYDGPVDEAAFRQEMAIMAAQRNAKIVGIFARLYSRDGNARYLDLLPRVWSYLERDLAHPALAPLRAWYDEIIPKNKRIVEAR